MKVKTILPKLKKYKFVNPAYEYQEEKEEKEYKSPLEKHINKKKKKDPNKYKILANPNRKYLFPYSI